MVTPLDRASVRQQKTDEPVRFELTEQMRQSTAELYRGQGRYGDAEPSTSAPLSSTRRRSALTTVAIDLNLAEPYHAQSRRRGQTAFEPRVRQSGRKPRQNDAAPRRGKFS
jgi:hypothetical protein